MKNAGAPVRIDAEQLYKALKYLATFLLQSIGACSKRRMSATVLPHGLQAEAEEWVYISLTGQGRRLPAEELQQLFDPFGVEQSALADVGPCVSQKIIAEDGGHLEVRQEKNGDTTFVIALPEAYEPTEATPQWTPVNVF
jgi:C4-dicarboxylate-specific signal transduction histidine kinase